MVFYNGEFIAKRDAFISSGSRAFNYGDAFFETVKIINSKPFNFSSHMERIKLSLSVLKLNNKYTSSFFEEKISHLLKVNEIINGSVKIHISRHGIGRYLPESNHTDVFISVNNGHSYKQNDTISLCFYDKECKAPGSLSNIKSANSLISVLASIYANENNFDNAILLNTSGYVIEVTNANIFILKNDRIYTPPLADGCVDGTMRKWISNELNVTENSILPDDLLDADEVFITNSSDGIRSIKTIEGIAFSSFKIADFLQQKLINSCLGF